MVYARRNDATRTPQQGGVSLGTDTIPAVPSDSSSSSITLLPLKPRNLCVEWATDLDGHNDRHEYVEDEDEFFDALENMGAGGQTDMQSAAAEQNVDMFALTGYESESQSRRGNRRHRLVRRNKKGGRLATFACCGSA
jgi:hypothetical protein